MKIYRRDDNIIRTIRISEYDNYNLLIEIIQLLINEKQIFLELTDEDTCFDTQSDDEKYRKLLPEYFKSKGTYNCVYDENLKKDNTPYFKDSFCYIATIENNKEFIDLLPKIFQYYGTVLMMGSNFEEDFGGFLNCIQEKNYVPELLVKQGVTKCFLVHGDYSDFIINIDRKEKELIEEVERIIRKYIS